MEAELQADVVVDTNVLLDLYSCHDLSFAYEAAGIDGLDGDVATWRRQRARDAILVAILLDRRRSSVFHLQHEFLEQVIRRVPIDDRDAFEHHYASIFHRLLKRALPHWQQVSDDLHPRFAERTPTAEAGIGAKGTAADLHLLDFARTHDIPLITNEGFTFHGVDDQHGLRRRAIEAQVRVYTPRQYFQGALDEERECRSFLKKMRSGVRGFLQGQPHPEIALRSVHAVLGVLRHVLFGTTRGAG